MSKIKPRIGDIIEIKTAKGLAYAMYTHRQPKYGALIRVFETIWSTRPESLAGLTTDRLRFSTFFPLEAALDQGIVEVVGNESIPGQLEQFPTFRAGMIDPKTKKVSVWWLWDGQREWRVGELSTEQRRLPIRGVWNDTMLVQRIETDWRPINDAR